MTTHLDLIGVALISIALAHAVFPRRFAWKEELASLSLMNRQMMKVHSFFIALAVLLMGLLCLTSAADLIGTVLGRKIALGLGVFWGVRLLVQLFGYSPRLWRGKRLETVLHLALTVLWAYFTAVFLLIAAGRG